MKADCKKEKEAYGQFWAGKTKQYNDVTKSLEWIFSLENIGFSICIINLITIEEKDNNYCIAFRPEEEDAFFIRDT